VAPGTIRHAVELVLSDAWAVLGDDAVSVTISGDGGSVSEMESVYPEHSSTVALRVQEGSSEVAALAYVPGEPGGTGICAFDGEPFAYLIARVADAVQVTVMEGQRNFGCAFPPCPIHRTHPLWPEARAETAVWACLVDPNVAIEVGCVTPDTPDLS
jgi:hypothetical protein